MTDAKKLIPFVIFFVFFFAFLGLVGQGLFFSSEENFDLPQKVEKRSSHISKPSLPSIPLPIDSNKTKEHMIKTPLEVEVEGKNTSYSEIEKSTAKVVVKETEEEGTKVENRVVRIEILPGKEIKLKPNESQTLEAKAYDSQGHLVDFFPTWTVSGGVLENEKGQEITFRSEERSASYWLRCFDAKSGKEVLGQIKVEASLYLSSIKIEGPDYPLDSGENYRFKARGFDQYKEEFPFEAHWSTEAGEIDHYGNLSAGFKPGKFVLSATDSHSAKSTQIWIEVAEKLSKIEIEGCRKALKTGEAFHFKAYGYNQEHNRMKFRTRWYAEGGKIDNHGYFVAGDKPGRYLVSVKNFETKLRQKTYIEIISRMITCPRCQGYKRIKIICTTCNGKGKHIKNPEHKEEDCYYCENGYVWGECAHCQGRGQVER